jgi:hypothetical protein
MNEQKDKQPQPSQQGATQDQDRQRIQSNIENPDQPEVKTDVSDDPAGTKKKIPNMQDKH